jgi:hypothetical protein
MKKVAVLMLVGGVACAAVMKRKRQSAGPQPSMWDKMREGMEAMPEDFPPRVMFDNVATVRENTERILKILEEGGSDSIQEGAEEDA